MKFEKNSKNVKTTKKAFLKEMDDEHEEEK